MRPRLRRLGHVSKLSSKVSNNEHLDGMYTSCDGGGEGTWIRMQTGSVSGWAILGGGIELLW
jgi:hypothetical protein